MVYPVNRYAWNRNAQISALRSVGRELETLMVIIGSMIATEKSQALFRRSHNNLTERLAIYSAIKKIATHVEKMALSQDYDTDINEALRSLSGSLEWIEGEGDANLTYMAKVCEDALHDACIHSTLTEQEEQDVWKNYDSDETPQPEYQKEWNDENHSFSI